MIMFSTIRLRAAAMLGALALGLTGCFMSPGKFASDLYLTGPDSFTFTYEGEIFFLGLSKLAQMGTATQEPFNPVCYDEDSFEPRECSLEETTQQRKEWEATATLRAAEKKKEAAQMAALMGGIDPSDPKAADELVALLKRQKGWERVISKGDGVFEVTYRVSGALGHDFMFPVIEGFPATNPFVQVILRNGGQVRINAPGFSAQNNGDNPMGGMMGVGSIAGLVAMGAGEQGVDGETLGQLPGIPQIDGTFTVHVGAGMRILANNTDEGPVIGTAGEMLSWRITPRTAQAPTALIATTR